MRPSFQVLLCTKMFLETLSNQHLKILNYLSISKHMASCINKN